MVEPFLVPTTARLDSMESQNGLSKLGGCDGWKRRYCGPADAAAGAIGGSDLENSPRGNGSLPNMRFSMGGPCCGVPGPQRKPKRWLAESIQCQATRVWAYCDHFVPLATESNPRGAIGIWPSLLQFRRRVRAPHRVNSRCRALGKNTGC